MRNRLFGTLIFVVVLLFAMPCFSQGQDKVPIPPTDKSIEWIDIRVPTLSPLARQARIVGTVAIEVRFDGCELDPASPRVVSGHPLVAPAAMESLKQSSLRCGDFADSNATVSYEFGEYATTTPCEYHNPRRVEIAGNRIRVLSPPLCYMQ
jgi:hypothetical protein